MAEITLSPNTYSSYASQAEADEYLLPDLIRSAVWAALSNDNKARALITASRYLATLDWTDGPPDYESPPAALVEATALFAADISIKPTLANEASTGSNVKRVKGGEAEVEFFRPSAGTLLPSHIMRLIGHLLGNDITWPGDGIGGEGGTAYGSSDYERSRFEPGDWSINRSYS